MPAQTLEQDIQLLKRIQDEALKTKAILQEQQQAISNISNANATGAGVIGLLQTMRHEAMMTEAQLTILLATQEKLAANTQPGVRVDTGGGSNTIPGGAPETNTTSNLQAQLDLQRAVRKLEEDAASLANSTSQKRIIAAQQALEAEQKRLNLIQQEVTYNEKYGKANAIASKAGFAGTDITNLQQVGTSGITKVTYGPIEDELTGANKKLDLFVTKSGDAIPAVSRQFQTMGTAIARDTMELFKWTLAIGIIYGPLRELQTLTTQMVANQANLATSMIALVGTSTSLAQVFGIIADSANKMGEDVGGTIDIFTQAYRATGGLASQYERVKTASELMSTAMTLAKLSGMDYNTAIDTLTASLRQQGLGLEEGGSLLDKWVAVSKVANVDLQTLSTGFSILGESAGAAGLDTEHLNALLATISETLGVTDRQAGNAAKAFISGFGTSKAQKALQDIGVAATNMNGELRPVIDIMKELASMEAAGVLSPAQFTQVTTAIGGGTRRQAVVAAVLGNSGRMDEIVAAQQTSAGAAAQALATKLDTVQTSLVRLGNALQTVAQTMGTSGGLLDDFKWILDIVTKLVTGIDSLSAALGKAAPILATVILASAVMKIRPDIGTSFVGGFSNLLSPGIGTNISGLRKYPGIEEPVQVESTGFGFGANGPSKTAQWMLGGSLGAGAAIGGLAALLPAMQNFKQGNVAAGGGNLVGGVIGGVLGNMIAPGMGTVIGASVGSGIAEAFVKNVLQYKGEIGGAFALAEKNAKEAAAAAALQAGGTPTGTAEDKFTAVQKQVLESGNGKFANIFQSWFGNMVMGATKQQGRWNPEMVAYMNASTGLQQQYQDAYQALLVSKGTTGAGTTASSRAQKQLETQYGSMADQMQTAMQQQLLAQLTGKTMGGGKATGSITSAQYTAGMTNISGFNEVASKMSVAFGPEFKQNAVGIKDMKDEYQAFIDLLVYGGDTETKTLTELASTISDVTNNLDVNNLTITINGEEITKTRKEWEKYLADLKLTAGASAAALSNQISFSQLKQPNVVGGNTALQNVDMFNKIYGYAQTLDEKRVKAMNPLITDTQLAQYKAGLDKFITLVMDAGEEVYKGVEGVSSQAFQEAEAYFKQLGQVSRTQAPGSAQFQEINLPSSMLSKIVSATQTMQGRLQAAGMPINPEDMIAYFNDDQFKSLHLDSVALRLVLEQILNVQQKQLDQGMWNVPGNATIMVPINSVWNATHNAAQGGVGGNNQTTTTDDAKKAVVAAAAVATIKPITSNMGGFQYAGGSQLVPPSAGLSPAERYLTDPMFRLRNQSPSSTFDPSQRVRAEYGIGSPTTQSPSVLSQMTGGVFDKGGFFTQFWNNLVKDFTGLKDIGSTTAPTAAKLGLNLTSHMTIQLDGRTLAEAVKVYLLNDLVAMSKTYGTTSKDYVI